MYDVDLLKFIKNHFRAKRAHGSVVWVRLVLD